MSAIQARLAFLLWRAVDAAGLSLQVLTEGAVIPGLNASTNVRVPESRRDGYPDEPGQQAVPNPVLVIEILSPGNRDDTRDNVRAYSTLGSVQEIAVLHSARFWPKYHRRGPTGNWLTNPEFVGPGEPLRLPSVGLDCMLDDAYRGTWLTR